MKIKFLFVVCLVSLQTLLHSEDVNPFEVVLPKVQFIEFFTDGTKHCIPIYGNVFIGSDNPTLLYNSDEMESWDSFTRGATMAALLIKYDSETRPKLIKRVEKELMKNFRAEEKSENVYGAEFISSIWNDLYDKNPTDGLNITHSPDGIGVIQFVKNFKGQISAIEKTLKTMPADLQVSIYKKIFDKISDTLPKDAEFTNAIESKIDADFQAKIDSLQKQIDALKAKIR